MKGPSLLLKIYSRNHKTFDSFSQTFTYLSLVALLISWRKDNLTQNPLFLQRVPWAVLVLCLFELVKAREAPSDGRRHPWLCDPGPGRVHFRLLPKPQVWTFIIRLLDWMDLLEITAEVHRQKGTKQIASHYLVTLSV